ncbi:MAG: BatA domain-containing protein, partial [Pseudomonadota bacterium]
MLSVGSLAFLNPWLLAGLVALPILWWLLRTIPPSPRTQTFPGVRLLLGLEDDERQSDKSPWWLLLLRCLAIAAALIGFANPVSNLTERLSGSDGPLLVLMDQGWASAPEWAERKATARAVLDEAGQAGRDVILWPAAEGTVPPVVSAGEAAKVLETVEARPWQPDHQAVLDALVDNPRGVAETVWLQDGLARDATADLLARLDSFGPVRVIQPENPPRALTPPRLEEGVLRADVLAADGGGTAQVIALAEAEEGGERRIAVANATLGDTGRATAEFDLPPQLQGTVSRIVLADRPSAGGSVFSDGAIRRITAALVGPQTEAAVTTLTSATHYIDKALLPWADITRATLAEVLENPPEAIVLADVGDMTDDQRDALTAWVEEGGLLVRFAGPRLASAIGAQGFGQARVDDPLLPVRLRRGGRVLGGALAWTTPRALGDFAETSPFRGLTPPDEVDVRTQVLAEPSPDLSGRVWAALDDGTPLVTAKSLGTGQVVLFHVSGDAEWSSLPLSGLFVEMLGRLMALAPGRSAGLPPAEDLQGTLWKPETLMATDGGAKPASTLADPVAGERLAEGGAGPDLAPGIYIRADAAGRKADADSVVVNLF